jgi:hypothetical protein
MKLETKIKKLLASGEVGEIYTRLTNGRALVEDVRTKGVGKNARTEALLLSKHNFESWREVTCFEYWDKEASAWKEIQ